MLIQHTIACATHRSRAMQLDKICNDCVCSACNAHIAGTSHFLIKLSLCIIFFLRNACIHLHAMPSIAEQCVHPFTRIVEQFECNARISSNAHALQILCSMVARNACIAYIHCAKKVAHLLLHSLKFEGVSY